MRIILGVLSLLLVVLMVGSLAKKQLAVIPTLVPTPTGAFSADRSATTPQQQSQQLQNQVRKSVEDALQQARPQTEEQ